MSYYVTKFKHIYFDSDSEAVDVNGNFTIQAINYVYAVQYICTSMDKVF